MKLKNLFYLLLALPLAFAACNKSEEPAPQPGPDGPDPDEPKPTPEYVIDKEMLGAMRLFEIPELELTFDANEFMVAFIDQNTQSTNILTLLILGNENDTYLQPGTYSQTFDETAGVVLQQGMSAYIDANGKQYLFTDVEVVVKLEEKEYDIEAIFEDEDDNKYRFTYKGEIVDMIKEPEAPKTPEFNLTSDETMEFTQDNQYGVIKFELVNPVAGATVTAKANAAWVKNFSVREADGEIAFEVEANTGAAREAKITATYGMLEFKVTVKQAEYVAPAPVIIIDSANEEFEAEGGNGEIAFHVNNAVAGTEATATTVSEWITINSVASGVVAYTVAANETESVREGKITIAYGEVEQEVKIKQYFDGYTPGMNYSVFEVIEIFASSEQGGKMWEVIFIEKDVMLGEMQTRICFNLPTADAQRVSDGTYSVENGGILVNTSTMNGYSTYRANGSLATDITVANITVATDTKTKTISFKGTFQAANNIVTLDYTGEVRGMDLGEAVTGTIECNRWQSVKKNWEEAGQFMFTAISSTGDLKILFDILHSGGSKLCPEGTYQVGEYVWQGDVLENSTKITFNGVESRLASGYITVKHITGGYNFTFELTDESGRSFKGSYSGPVENGTNPA